MRLGAFRYEHGSWRFLLDGENDDGLGSVRYQRVWSDAESNCSSRDPQLWGICMLALQCTTNMIESMVRQPHITAEFYSLGEHRNSQRMFYVSA